MRNRRSYSNVTRTACNKKEGRQSVVSGQRRKRERENVVQCTRLREREPFILAKGFGLVFCHPLLTSPLPAAPPQANFLTFATRCAPSCSTDNACPTVHGDNRTEIVTVLPSLEIHAESTGCIHPATFSSICLSASFARRTPSAPLFSSVARLRLWGLHGVDEARIGVPFLFFFFFFNVLGRFLFVDSVLIKKLL